MSRPIPASDYVEHFDPDLPHHRAWLLAVLEQLVAHEAPGSGGRRDPAAALDRPPGGNLSRAAAITDTTRGHRPSRGNPLSVPWFAQLDSATDQARRMCFSSSCAMLLAHVKPGVLTGPNGDDKFLARVRQFGVADAEQRTSGDATDPAAQIKALASYGIEARFTSKASFATLEQQIAAGIPVP